MNKNEWYQVGEDIKKQVQDAIDSNDFSELSKTIGETVGQAMGDVGKSINGAINDVVNEARESFQQTIKKTPSRPHRQGHQYCKYSAFGSRRKGDCRCHGARV